MLRTIPATRLVTGQTARSFSTRLSGLTWYGSSVTTRMVRAAAGPPPRSTTAAHPDRAAAGAVCVLDAVAADDEAAGREVRARDRARMSSSSSSSLGRLRVVQRPGRRRRRPRAGCAAAGPGRHADRDTARTAVDQQVRDPRRAGRPARWCPSVVVRDLKSTVSSSMSRSISMARLRRAGHSVYRIRRRGVVARRAKVALAGRSAGSPHRPRLRHAGRGCRRSRLSTVRVIVAHHLADDTRALDVTRGRGGTRESNIAYSIPPVHRLEPVAHVRQRPARR